MFDSFVVPSRAMPRAAASLLILSLLALAPRMARAAANDGLDIRYSTRLRLPIFVSARGGGAIQIPPAAQANAAQPNAARPSPLDFFTTYPSAFGVKDPATQLVQIKQQTDSLGFTHTSYQQVHHGIPTFTGILRVHQNAAGDIISVNGRFYPIFDAKFDVNPSIGADAARQVADATLLVPNLEVELNELVIVDPGWYGNSTMGPKLAWHVILRNLPLVVRESFFIDAHTSEVLDHWNMICDAKNRQIYDGGGGTAIPGTLVRAEGAGPVASPADANRAYDYYSDVYDFYLRGFGRDSIDAAGLTMVATVNSTAPGCPNAYWNGAQMVFCLNTVTDDVVGHELTHGVTQYTAGLVYLNQSGQLNESFSDVFGELIDLYNGNAAFAGPPGGTPWPPTPTGPGLDTANNHRTNICSTRSSGFLDGVRWLLGEDANAFSSEIRDMWMPTCHNQPDRANSALQTCNPNDSGGVHSGSGVPNHAFALITDGGTFNGQTTVGIGPIKAGAVWYRALTTYLTPSSDFEDAYAQINQAAQDLIGTTPLDPRTGGPSASAFTAANATDVDHGLIAVEMNTPGLCGANDDVLDDAIPSQCPNATVIYSDNFESGVNGWTVSNTGPPQPFNWVQTTAPAQQQHPSHVWFCSDPLNGDCQADDESAIHTLFSPTIPIPANAANPVMSFSHFLASEGGWDGGNVKVSVNGGAWQSIPRNAFQFNPYNGRLNTTVQGNTDPMQGQDGWTGVGGKWGVSVIELRGIAAPGGTLQVRFDFGKDGCNGDTGWYVDDFVIYNCPDCDANGAADFRQMVYVNASEPLGNIGTGSPQSFSLGSPPPAAGNVKLTLTARGDFSTTTEYLDLTLNGTNVGRAYQFGGTDCPNTPDREEITIPAATFNAAVAGGPATLTMTATADVNPAACTGTWVMLFIRYPLSTPDCNGNLVPDKCDRAAAGVGAFVDALLGNAPYSCLFDFDANLVIDGRDVQPYVRATVGP